MSKQYKALIQKRADLKKEQEAIFALAEKETRELTEQEKTRDDAIYSELKALGPDIERHERRREFERNAVALEGDGDVTEVHDLYAEKGFANVGEQLLAVVRSKNGPQDVRLSAINEKRLKIMGATGMHEAGFAEGGAFLQTEYSNTLMERTYDTGQVLSRVPVQPIAPSSSAYSALLVKETSRATGSRYGGLRVYRVGEGSTITGSRPEFDRKEIKPLKLAALVYLTDELIRDATALQGHVERLFPLEASFLMEDELFNGTGTNQSTGVLNATATVSVAKETGQAAASIVYQNLLKMWARLWSGSEGQAAWYANKDIFPQLLQMYQAAGTGGMPAQGITFVNGKFNIFGAPVNFVEYCQTLGTVGDIQLVDFSQYLAVTKGGMKTDTSIHVAFTTDETALRFVWSYGAEPLWRSALTPKNGSNTLSPFLTLATRS